ncbi:MAG: phosphate ABC transporter permease PstA [Rickettsiales bacterium]
MSKGQRITAQIESGLAARYRTEARFRAYGIAALAFAGIMLAVLLITIIRPGIGGFLRHEIILDIDTAAIADQLRNDPTAIDYHALTNAAMKATQEDTLTDKSIRHRFLALSGTFAALDVKSDLLGQPDQWGRKITVSVPLADNADQFLKGHIDRTLPEIQRPLNDQQIAWIDAWEKQGRIHTSFNRDFFSRGDSRAPEAAGFLGAIVGSLISLFVCMAVALPVAIAAAITLEEFAKKTWLANALEVIINNLAAVPSIIYGLLGLSIYLQWFGMPRSSPLVGGLTLAMLIMPVMIIAARAAIRAVPPSMRLAATGLGATKLQVVRDHVLPYALPGILTGTILSICRALGESAPLLMIGMVAFVADIPRGLTDPSTVMPVEIYLWAQSPELGFIEKTSSAILVLLAILLLLNWGAIKLRNKSQLIWN